MKLSIEGTPAEIKNALQAICGSEEREEMIIPMSREKANQLSINLQKVYETLKTSFK